MNYLPRRIDPNAFRQQSEGIDSAQRINGTAPELIGLPVIDPAYLDEQLFKSSPQAMEDEAQMAAIREWRECHNIEFAENEPYNAKSLALAVAVVGALSLLVWHLSPELRGLFSILTY